MTSTSEHTVTALCKRSDEISRAAGWVDDANPRPYETGASLMHSELSEALEDYRNHKPLNQIYYEMKFKIPGKDNAMAIVGVSELEAIGIAGPGAELVNKKPCGIPIELADFIIRVCQEVGTSGWTEEFSRRYYASTEPLRTSFDKLLADLHLFTSKSYEAFLKKDLGSQIWYLANGVYTAFTFCDWNNIDLWAAIDEKEAFNRTRAFRHGGKKC
jgi:hypothetical protein